MVDHCLWVFYGYVGESTETRVFRWCRISSIHSSTPCWVLVLKEKGKRPILGVRSKTTRPVREKQENVGPFFLSWHVLFGGF